MIEDLPDDGLDDPGDEDDLEAGPPADRPTRGLLWVFVPAVLGLLVATTYKAIALIGSTEGAWSLALLPATAIGAGIGLGVGAIIWAFFPYKSTAKKERRDDGTTRE